MNRDPQNGMEGNFAFTDAFPEVNETGGFLVMEELRSERILFECWMEFINVSLLAILHYSSAKYTEKIPMCLDGKLPVDRLPYELRSQLGMVEEIPVIRVDYADGERIDATMLMDVTEMVRIYFSEPERWTAKGYTARAILDRFFAHLWVKGLLLYPLRHPEGYQRPAAWKTVLSVSAVFLKRKMSLFHLLLKRFEPMGEEVSRTRKYRLNAIGNLMVCTTWREKEDVTEEGLVRAEKAVMKHLPDRKRLIKFARLVINDIRYALVNDGRGDIVPPRRKAEERRNPGKRFPDFIDIGPDAPEELVSVMRKGEVYLDVLRAEGMAKGTVSGTASSLNTLFRYLIRHYPGRELDRGLVDEIYDPNNPSGLVEHIRSTGVSESTLVTKMKHVSGFLDHFELYTPFARKNTPVESRKKRKTGARTAMPAEMVRHIHDIILNRPPNAPVKWYRDKADASWWEHEVWPVLPLLFLFLYSIPLRGGQARHLCRERSFVLDPSGERIERFVINTDKNVNRKDLLEIPCAWDELQIFVPFLRWHREYFPHLRKIVYNDDENSPWEEIEPVMILPDSSEPLSKGTMMDYHRRLLCVYQLEVMEEAKAQGKKDWPVVAWSKSGKPFFESREEIDRATRHRIKDIQTAYDIHALRVTGATRYLEAGLGIPHLMMLTGHVTPNVLLSIYVKLTEEERRRALTSAIRNIRLGKREEAVESGKTFIAEEIVEAWNGGDEALAEALERNDLFSLPRKADSTREDAENVRLGTEIAFGIHPSNWRPMVHGICPAASCPEGRENRCSLCPFFITGRLFLDGVTLMANRALARFQRGAVQMREEKEKGYASSARAAEQEAILEEILGYYEILERIEKGLDGFLRDREETEEEKARLPSPGGVRVVTEKVPETFAYLRNEYEAGLFGVERDFYGMKVLTIEAMKIAASGNDTEELHTLAGSPERAIDYLMGHYLENPREIGEQFRKFAGRVSGLLPSGGR